MCDIGQDRPDRRNGIRSLDLAGIALDLGSGCIESVGTDGRKLTLGFVGNGLGVAAGVDAVSYTEFDLVRIGDRVEFVKADYAVEIVNAFSIAIGHERFDHVAKLERIVLAVIIFRKCDRPYVHLELAVFSNNVLFDQLPHVVKGIGVIRHPQGTADSEVNVLGADRQGELRKSIVTQVKDRRPDRIAACLRLVQAEVGYRLTP